MTWADFPNECPVTRRTLNRAWVMARKVAPRPHLYLHDLPHSGLSWSAVPARPPS